MAPKIERRENCALDFSSPHSREEEQQYHLLLLRAKQEVGAVLNEGGGAPNRSSGSAPHTPNSEMPEIAGDFLMVQLIRI